MAYTTTKYLSNLRQIEEWNAVGRQTDWSNKEEVQELWENQTEFVTEEILETIRASNDLDIVEILDGTADILVTLGYKITMALASNMYEEPDLELIADICDEEDLNTFEQAIDGLGKSELYLLKRSMLLKLIELNSSPLGGAGLPGDIYVLLYRFIKLSEAFTGVDFTDVITDVLDSNWSKYPLLEQVDITDEVVYIKENRKLAEEVNYRIVGDRVVFTNQNDKIMKPSTFREVNQTAWGL